MSEMVSVVVVALCKTFEAYMILSMTTPLTLSALSSVTVGTVAIPSREVSGEYPESAGANA